MYKWKYETPEGFSNMLMNSDGEYLTGLWFEGSRDVSKHIIDCEEKKLPIFDEIIKWLDVYFSGKNQLLFQNTNPICIIIPCHRVVATNGSLTGYGGGIKNKIKLLELEGLDMSKFIIPTKGTAL